MQDGEPPGAGTVIRDDAEIFGYVWVKWDTGKKGIYRMGSEGKYDLQPTDIPGGEIEGNELLLVLISE